MYFKDEIKRKQTRNDTIKASLFIFELMGLGGGQVVNVLTFYSDDSSSNPANVYSFSSVKLFEKNKNKQKKEDGNGLI